MTRRRRSARGIHWITAVVALAGATILAPAAQATSSAQSGTPVEALVELDEVLSLGKVTANMVATAETRLYRRYNQLNRKNRYDVHCGDITGDIGSRILRRTCLPDFTSEYLAPIRSGFSSRGARCDGVKSSTTIDSPDDPWYLGNCIRHQMQFGMLEEQRHRYVNAAFTRLVPAEERARFAENVLRVIDRDPQLQDMAAGLARLYTELDRIQAHYDNLREEKRAAWESAENAAVPRRHPGK